MNISTSGGLIRAKDNLKSEMETYQKSIRDVYNIQADEIKDKPKYDVSSETKKADEFDKLHIAMKENLILCSYSEKKKLLNLVPETVGPKNIVQNVLMFQNT